MEEFPDSEPDFQYVDRVIQSMISLPEHAGRYRCVCVAVQPWACRYLFRDRDVEGSGSEALHLAAWVEAVSEECKVPGRVAGVIKSTDGSFGDTHILEFGYMYETGFNQPAGLPDISKISLGDLD